MAYKEMAMFDLVPVCFEITPLIHGCCMVKTVAQQVCIKNQNGYMED